MEKELFKVLNDEQTYSEYSPNSFNCSMTFKDYKKATGNVMYESPILIGEAEEEVVSVDIEDIPLKIENAVTVETREVPFNIEEVASIEEVPLNIEEVASIEVPLNIEEVASLETEVPINREETDDVPKNLETVSEETDIFLKIKEVGIDKELVNSEKYDKDLCEEDNDHCKDFQSSVDPIKSVCDEVLQNNVSVTQSNKNFQCNFCENLFTQRSSLYRHIRTLHEVEPQSVGIKNIACPLNTCPVKFTRRERLREHIQDAHNVVIELHEDRFVNYDEFKAWKGKVEKETKCFYVANKSPKVIGLNEQQIYFSCHRSGFSSPKVCGKRKMKSLGSKKINGCCPSSMVISISSSEVKVKFWKTHFGHETEIGYLFLTSEDKRYIAELAGTGISFEELIRDLKGTDYIDAHHMFPIKKRYVSWVKSAYQCEEYDTEKSDLECVSEWVQKCCELEEVPVLLCNQENIGCEDQKFILAIMTEFQKHIFMSSSKHIICVDTHNRASDHHLVIVSIMDELNTAFPVAYCITNKLNKDIMTEFFMCIQESTGNLSPKYLMSSFHTYIYEAWCEVMGYSPIWLWSRWHIGYALRAHLRIYIKENVSLRCQLFNIMKVIIDCKNKEIFECLFRNFIDRLKSDVNTEKVGNWIVEKLGSDSEKWAHCYRKEISCRTNLHLEMLHDTFHTCGKMGRKRLYTLICVLLKVLRYKILDRILNSFDNIKFNLAKNAIDLCHDKGMSILSEQVCSLSDKLWQIESEDSEKVYVTQEMEKCPEQCGLHCKDCNICVHQYSCSCVHSMINANLCMHIHAVAIKFFSSFKPPVTTSPTIVDFARDNIPVLNAIEKNPKPLDIILSKTIELHQSVQSSTLNEESLARVTKYLNACLKIVNRSKNGYLSSNVPINNVSAIATQDNTHKLVSSSKPTHKRTLSSISDSNSVSKLQKTNNSLSSTPLYVLLISNPNNTAILNGLKKS